MIVTLYVVGKLMLICLFTSQGNFCANVIGDPSLIIAAGGFEYLFEIWGVAIYRKNMKK